MVSTMRYLLANNLGSSKSRSYETEKMTCNCKRIPLVNGIWRFSATWSQIPWNLARLIPSHIRLHVPKVIIPSGSWTLLSAIIDTSGWKAEDDWTSTDHWMASYFVAKLVLGLSSSTRLRQLCLKADINVWQGTSLALPSPTLLWSEWQVQVLNQ